MHLDPTAYLRIEAHQSIDTSAFGDLQPGKGRGQAGAGAKLISVRTSAADGGAGGRIVLVRQ